MDAFILDKIKAIGRDPVLVAETVRAATEGAEARRPEVMAEIRRLGAEQKRLESERGNLLDAIAEGGAGAKALRRRLEDTERAAQEVEARLSAAGAELRALDGEVIDAGDLQAALERFDPIWDALFPREKQRVLHLLVEEIRYDAGQDEVEIVFRPSGIRTLIEDRETEEVA